MWTKSITSLFFLCCCILLADGMLVKIEHSLAGPFIVGSESLAWWDLTGSAQLAQTDLRLTTDEHDKYGAIWNNHPIYANDWEVQMQFHIHGKGLMEFGDGIAIWYVKDKLHSGPVFGSKDHFNGLGVFIDTRSADPLSPHKHMHPYISAVVNNEAMRYHHDAEGTAGEVGSCQMELRNLQWPTRIAVSYISHVLTVFLNVQSTGEWVQCFRAQGIYLPTGYNLGVSAKTTTFSDIHDIITITTLDMTPVDRQWEDRSHIIPFAEEYKIPARYDVVDEGEVKFVPLQKEEIKIVPQKEEIKIVPQKEEIKTVPQKEEIKTFPQKEEIKTVPQEEVKIVPQKKEEKKIIPQKEEKQFFDRKEEKQSFQQKTEEKKVEKIDLPKSATFFTKVLYVSGTLLILFLAYKICRKYLAQRKERMQKRLF